MTPGARTGAHSSCRRKPRGVREIAQLAMVGEGVVRGLVDAGTLLPVAVSADAPFDVPDSRVDGPILSPDQAAAAEALMQAVGARLLLLFCWKA